MSSWTCKRSWSGRTIFLCKYICIFTTLSLHNIGLSLSLYNGVPADSSVECEAYAVFAMLVMVWFRHHHIGRLGDHEAGSYMPAICFDFMTSTKGDIILTNGIQRVPNHPWAMLPGCSEGRCHSGQHAAFRPNRETCRDVSWCKMKRRNRMLEV